MKTTILMGAVALVCAASAQTVKLTPVPTGFMKKQGGYMPQRLPLTDAKPSNITKLPAGLTNAKFGVLTIGGKSYDVCIGDLPGKPWQLFVDTNGNGDLTDDPTPTWTVHQSRDQAGNSHSVTVGSALVGFHLAGSSDPVSIGVYEFDPADAQRAALKDTLLYYNDYGYTGEVKLKGKSLPFILTDDFVTGTFQGKPEGKQSGVRVGFDRDGSGKYAARGNMYDATKPFNLDGTTYEVAKVDALKGTATFKVSSTTVAEVMPLPTFKVGQPFPGFKAVTMDKSEVNFPSSYKGHIVLLDFWATWCGPCMGEVPNITAAYEKYHDKGFDILGISLDQKDSAQKVIDVTKSKNMTWPQVYDGGFWEAKVAVQYGIQSIPHAFLVDGDTGELLADGESLRGDGLAKLIEEKMTKKGLLK